MYVYICFLQIWFKHSCSLRAENNDRASWLFSIVTFNHILYKRILKRSGIEFELLLFPSSFEKHPQTHSWPAQRRWKERTAEVHDGPLEPTSQLLQVATATVDTPPRLGHVRTMRSVGDQAGLAPGAPPARPTSLVGSALGADAAAREPPPRPRPNLGSAGSASLGATWPGCCGLWCCREVHSRLLRPCLQYTRGWGPSPLRGGLTPPGASQQPRSPRGDPGQAFTAAQAPDGASGPCDGQPQGRAAVFWGARPEVITLCHLSRYTDSLSAAGGAQRAASLRQVWVDGQRAGALLLPWQRSTASLF